MSPRFEFSIHLTEPDIAGTYAETAAGWRRCIIPGAVIALLGFGELVYSPDMPGAGSLTLVFGILLIYCGTFMVGAFRRAAVRRFRLNPLARVRTTYRIFDEYLNLDSELLQSEIRWQGFLGYKEAKSYLLLATELMHGFVIPYAQLPADQVQELRDYIKARIPSVPKGKELRSRAWTPVS